MRSRNQRRGASPPTSVDNARTHSGASNFAQRPCRRRRTQRERRSPRSGVDGPLGTGPYRAPHNHAGRRRPSTVGDRVMSCLLIPSGRSTSPICGVGISISAGEYRVGPGSAEPNQTFRSGAVWMRSACRFLSGLRGLPWSASPQGWSQLPPNSMSAAEHQVIGGAFDAR